MAKAPTKYIEARTDEILSAAIECFARQGYRGTSMSDIAAESGMSVGGLYRYFDGKDALFHALTQHASEVNQAMWLEVTDAEGATEGLREFVNRYLDMATDPACRIGLALDLRLLSEALDSGVVRREVEKAYLAQIGVISELLRSAKGLDHIDDESETEAQALIALLVGAGFRILVGSDIDMAAYRKTTLAAVDAWTCGK